MRSCELIPFKMVAQSSDTDMILMAHLQIDALDKDNITTTSKACYDFLRSELGYQGPIISDDMEMKAIFDKFTPEEASMKAFKAGCDILVYRSMNNAQKAYDGLCTLVGSGKISYEELCQKKSRIIDLKKKRLQSYRPISLSHRESILDLEESKHFLKELEKKITEKKNQVSV